MTRSWEIDRVACVRRMQAGQHTQTSNFSQLDVRDAMPSPPLTPGGLFNTGNASMNVGLRLCVSTDGIVAAALAVSAASKVSVKATMLAVTATATLSARRNGTTKTELASERHAQRLIAARQASERKGEERKLPPSKYTSKPPLKQQASAQALAAAGPQLLFVHFIPPSLRKAGKDKIPWIVHSTSTSSPACAACCREATHVHFRGVQGFETYEGAALEQTCACTIAQHHLRGTGCLRWEGDVAIIESAEVAARACAETQTEPPATSHEVQTQTCTVCADADAQTDNHMHDEIRGAGGTAGEHHHHRTDELRQDKRLAETSALVASLQRRVAELEAEAEASRRRSIRSVSSPRHALTPSAAVSSSATAGASAGGGTAPAASSAAPRSARQLKSLQATRRGPRGVSSSGGAATDRAGAAAGSHPSTALHLPRSVVAAERSMAAAARRGVGHEPMAAWAAG